MEKTTLRNNNNFDFLRLLFATFVIITHSYPLTGAPEIDWLNQLTEKQLTFSYIGVRGFFIISGYLIFESLIRSETLASYAKKRHLSLRISYSADAYALSRIQHDATYDTEYSAHLHRRTRIMASRRKTYTEISA